MRSRGEGWWGRRWWRPARLGARAEVWAWVGEDEEGELVIEGLRAEGVDTSGVEVISGERTPVSFIQVEEGSGERTIYHRRGVEVKGERARLAGRELSCDVLLVDAVWPEASRSAAEMARAAGIPVVGDFCPGEGLRGLAAMVDALIVPRGCAERLAPEGSWEQRLRVLAELGPSFAAITAGEEGATTRREGGGAPSGVPGGGGGHDGGGRCVPRGVRLWDGAGLAGREVRGVRVGGGGTELSGAGWAEGDPDGGGGAPVSGGTRLGRLGFVMTRAWKPASGRVAAGRQCWGGSESIARD